MECDADASKGTTSIRMPGAAPEYLNELNIVVFFIKGEPYVRFFYPTTLFDAPLVRDPWYDISLRYLMDKASLQTRDDIDYLGRKFSFVLESDFRNLNVAKMIRLKYEAFFYVHALRLRSYLTKLYAFRLANSRLLVYWKKAIRMFNREQNLSFSFFFGNENSEPSFANAETTAFYPGFANAETTAFYPGLKAGFANAEATAFYPGLKAATIGFYPEGELDNATYLAEAQTVGFDWSGERDTNRINKPRNVQFAVLFLKHIAFDMKLMGFYFGEDLEYGIPFSYALHVFYLHVEKTASDAWIQFEEQIANWYDLPILPFLELYMELVVAIAMHCWSSFESKGAPRLPLRLLRTETVLRPPATLFTKLIPPKTALCPSFPFFGYCSSYHLFPSFILLCRVQISVNCWIPTFPCISCFVSYVAAYNTHWSAGVSIGSLFSSLPILELRILLV